MANARLRDRAGVVVARTQGETVTFLYNDQLTRVRELNRRYERERELDAGTREFVERMVAQMRGKGDA